MAAISNATDCPDRNITLSDDESTSIALLPTDEESNSIELLSQDEDTKPSTIISPDRVSTQSQEMERPWKRIRDLPSYPVGKPSRLTMRKLPDPKPEEYFPKELNSLKEDTICIHCKHTICHDLLYGDFCGLQATHYAKSQKKGICHETQFRINFESNYTSSLKYHRYMSIGVIDVKKRYEIPQCMIDSSYRFALTVFKVQQEQSRMERVYMVDGKTWSLRAERYKFEKDGNEKIRDKPH
jgi:hypothetical protein